MTVERLSAQLAFISEIDKLKGILRRTPLIDNSRRENTAEHSWHLAMMACLLAEHAPEATDVARAVLMALVHDIVEIDAGDTFAYDYAGYDDKAEREQRAADRLFGLLPCEQATELRALWEEFEMGTTPTAQFAVALDRLQPLIQNLGAGGGSWTDHGVRRSQVYDRMAPVESALPTVWPWLVDQVEISVRAGLILPDES